MQGFMNFGDDPLRLIKIRNDSDNPYTCTPIIKILVYSLSYHRVIPEHNSHWII